MTSRLIEVMLWLGAAGTLCAGSVSARRKNADLDSPHAPFVVPLPSPADPRDSDSLLAAIEVIAEGNLFRPDRSRPDSVPAAAVALGPPLPPAPPKAQLRLRGLVGGPPWDALIEGIPGHDGAVVARVGQTLGGITIRAVRRDTVIAQGMDTTWKLTLTRN